MKIEYIHEGSSDCPLIRIYAFKNDEIDNLYSIISGLAEGKYNSATLHDLPFMNSIENCRLTFYVNEDDKGIALSQDNNFECRLTRDSWFRVMDLVAPFKNDINGFQWLDEEGPVSLLLSKDGRW